VTPEQERAEMRGQIAQLAKAIIDTQTQTAAALEAMDKRTDQKLERMLDQLIDMSAKNRPENRPPPTEQAPSMGGFGEVIEMARPLLDIARQVGLIGGGGNSMGLDDEFASILSMMQQQALLQLKNDYRRKLGLPVLSQHVQEAGHQ
jgi:hypothetical protein